MAIDASGNLYIADSGGQAIKEWHASTQTLTTLASSTLDSPAGVAVDAWGNVYIADTYDNALKEWDPSRQTVTTLASLQGCPEGIAVDDVGDGIVIAMGNTIQEWDATTGTVGPLVSSGLSYPQGVAVDASGNVYIADTYDNAIKEWNVSTQTLTTLVSSGLNHPYGVAVDESGNVYIADKNDNAIKEWNASTQTLTTLVSSGLNHPYGVAVDESGNVYIADTYDNAIKEWNASTQSLTALVSSGLTLPCGVALDESGNVYIADTQNDAIKEVSRAFVPCGAVIEPPAAGSYQLPPVLPRTEPLEGLFAPVSDQSWLGGGDREVAGVVTLSLAQNTGLSRTAHITILGQSITVSQAASGDVNGDGVVNAADIDAVYQHLGQPANSPWKIVPDGQVVGQEDVDYLVNTILNTAYGDANLDCKVDFYDFQQVLYHWCQQGAGWAGGDFNGDGVVDFGDFQLLLDNWNPTGTGLGPPPGGIVYPDATTASSTPAIADVTTASATNASVVTSTASAGQSTSAATSVASATQVTAVQAAVSPALAISEPGSSALCVLPAAPTASGQSPAPSGTTPPPLLYDNSSDAASAQNDGHVDILAQLCQPVLD